MTKLSTPSTKGDIRRLDRKLATTNRSLKSLDKSLRRDLKAMEERIMRYFDLTIEKNRHDLLGVNHDQIEVLKDGLSDLRLRVSVLERGAGVAA